MSPLTIDGLFALASTRSAADTAIDDGEPLSYGELAARVARAARELREEHLLRPGDRALLIARNSADYLSAVLACAASGVVVVPASTQLKAGEIEYLLGNAEPRGVIAGEQFLDVVGKALVGSGQLETARVIQLDQLGRGAGRPDPSLPPATGRGPAPDDLLYLGYTSGTTGFPKGVRVSHGNRAQAILLQASEFQLGRGDRHLVVSPLYHTAPLTFALLHLCLGGTVVIHPEFDAAGIAEELAGGRTTNTFLAPSALRRVLQAAGPGYRPADALRAVVIGGSPCPAGVKAEAIGRFPGRLYEFYGATEVGVVTTLRPAEQATHPQSAGRLIPGAAIEVRDAATGALLPAGEVGQVWVRTVTRADGYFKINSSAGGGTWSYLGDIGYLDGDGYLYLVDRSTDIIISGGVNVYSREVELVLERHPAIADVAVFGVSDPQWGEMVAAAVSVRESQRIDDAELESFCRERLAAYKCPKAFFQLSELPRSETGKTDKRYLKTTYSS